MADSFWNTLYVGFYQTSKYDKFVNENVILLLTEACWIAYNSL
jgi:hypothetical protein